MTARVFIVDDHAEMRLLLRINLEHAGAGVVVCGETDTAEAALAAIGEAQADVVITDVNLPRMSGIELATHLRKRFPDLWIVVASVHDAGRFELEAKSAGADAAVSKADLERISELVVQFAARRRSDAGIDVAAPPSHPMTF